MARAIENQLLIIPGSIFSGRDTHFRISYAASEATIERGLGGAAQARQRLMRDDCANSLSPRLKLLAIGRGIWTMLRCRVGQLGRWAFWTGSRIFHRQAACAFVILDSEPRGSRASFANFCWQLLAECLRFTER